MKDKLDGKTMTKFFGLRAKAYLQKHGEKADNPSIRVYVNKIENRINI